MAFPSALVNNNADAGAVLRSNAAVAGLTGLGGLSELAQVQLAVANLLISDPSSVAVPAGDVLSGTFGENKSGGADTGPYIFPGTLSVTGALSFLATCISTTAIVTPSTFTGVTSVQFASSASGAVLMGFGTNDVTLKNRNGTDVLTIPASTTGLVAAGTLSVGGALTLLGGALGSSATLGIGYKSGAGGTVTQQTNRSTSVTLNTVCGVITTSNASLTALASATFTVSNSVVAIGDVVNVTMESGSTANTSIPYVSSTASGSFTITLYNRAAATGDVAAMVINFTILKGSSS